MMIEGGEKMLIKGKSRGDAIGYRRRSSQSFVAGGYGWSSVCIVHVVVRRPCRRRWSVPIWSVLPERIEGPGGVY